MSAETRENAIRRMKMRSIRRGIKEMDLLLGAYAETALDTMSATELQTYDRLLEENDHDLYAWATGRAACPAEYAAMIPDIASALHRQD